MSTTLRFVRASQMPDPQERGGATGFWNKVDRSGTCWVWTAARSEFGYGIYALRQDGRTRNDPAHRFSWRLHFGAIPDGLYVCHHCDNPPCVRPDHLFLGTPQANYLDMKRKGRLGRRQLLPHVVVERPVHPKTRGATAANAAKTQCSKGHPLSGENLAYNNGFRRCVTCRRAQQQRRRERLVASFIECEACHTLAPLFSKGLCARCYGRQRKRVRPHVRIERAA